MEENDHDGFVEISDVSGMEFQNSEDIAKSINDMGPYKIQTCQRTIIEEKDGVKTQRKVFDGYRLRIGDTSKFTEYQNGGVITQHKKPVQKHYRPLAENLDQPVAPGEWGLLFTDGAKFGRAEQLHVALLGLWKFQEQHGHLPHPNNEEEAAEVVSYAKEKNAELQARGEEAFSVSDLDEEIVRKVALYAAVDFQPLCAFFGGVVAQEVVKVTGKYQPLNQWLHLDAFEVLPTEKPTDTAPQNSRYDDLISLFGAEFRAKIANSRTFMVGCGALGCEYLKNFAMLGLGTGPRGGIVVTDNDRIEVSNLNRQFLFREHNVGQPKSVAASAAALKMNPGMHVSWKTLLLMLC